MTTTDDRPVFVDPSGRRRRVVRIVIGIAVTCVLGYLTLLVIALSGGPVKPSSLLPIPDDAPAPTTTVLVPTTSDSAPTTTTEDIEPVADTSTTGTTTTTTRPGSAPATPGSRRTDPPGASNRPTAPGRG